MAAAVRRRSGRRLRADGRAGRAHHRRRTPQASRARSIETGWRFLPHRLCDQPAVPRDPGPQGRARSPGHRRGRLVDAGPRASGEKIGSRCRPRAFIPKRGCVSPTSVVNPTWETPPRCPACRSSARMRGRRSRAAQSLYVEGRSPGRQRLEAVPAARLLQRGISPPGALRPESAKAGREPGTPRCRRR